MKINSKPGPLMAPLPTVMVSCGYPENSGKSENSESSGSCRNILTVAWTGIINTNPPMTYISVRRSRYSHDIIEKTGEFVINVTTADLVKAMDFCGVRSGRDIDKFEHLGLTPEKGDLVNAPMIAESPVNLECKVTEIKSFPTHDMFIAEIVAVHIDDKYVDENGAYDYGKMDLVSFSHGKYYRLRREELGFFGYSVMKPKTARRRRAQQHKKRNSRKRG